MDRSASRAGIFIDTISRKLYGTASAPLADVHHRQPAIVNPEHFSVWLDGESPADTLLDLARKPRAGPYEIRAVSTRVNSVRNDDPDILTPTSQQRLF